MLRNCRPSRNRYPPDKRDYRQKVDGLNEIVQAGEQPQAVVQSSQQSVKPPEQNHAYAKQTDSRDRVDNPNRQEALPVPVKGPLGTRHFGGVPPAESDRGMPEIKPN